MRGNNDEYRRVHGHNPRGHGRWHLRLTGTDGNGAYTVEEYQETGLLTHAKRGACKRMKAEIARVTKVVEVEVLP